MKNFCANLVLRVRRGRIQERRGYATPGHDLGIREMCWESCHVSGDAVGQWPVNATGLRWLTRLIPWTRTHGVVQCRHMEPHIHTRSISCLTAHCRSSSFVAGCIMHAILICHCQWPQVTSWKAHNALLKLVRRCCASGAGEQLVPFYSCPCAWKAPLWKTTRHRIAPGLRPLRKKASCCPRLSRRPAADLKKQSQSSQTSLDLSFFISAVNWSRFNVHVITALVQSASLRTRVNDCMLDTHISLPMKIHVLQPTCNTCLVACQSTAASAMPNADWAVRSSVGWSKFSQGSSWDVPF